MVRLSLTWWYEMFLVISQNYWTGSIISPFYDTAINRDVAFFLFRISILKTQPTHSLNVFNFLLINSLLRYLLGEKQITACRKLLLIRKNGCCLLFDIFQFPLSTGLVDGWLLVSKTVLLHHYYSRTLSRCQLEVNRDGQISISTFGRTIASELIFSCNVTP